MCLFPIFLVTSFDEAEQLLGHIHDNNSSNTHPHYIHLDKAERRMYVGRGNGADKKLYTCTYKFEPIDLHPLPIAHSITKLTVDVDLVKA